MRTYADRFDVYEAISKKLKQWAFRMPHIDGTTVVVHHKTNISLVRQIIVETVGEEEAKRYTVTCHPM